MSQPETRPTWREVPAQLPDRVRGSIKALGVLVSEVEAEPFDFERAEETADVLDDAALLIRDLAALLGIQPEGAR